MLFTGTSKILFVFKFRGRKFQLHTSLRLTLCELWLFFFSWMVNDTFLKILLLYDINYLLPKCYCYSYFVFSSFFIWVFFHEHLRFTGHQGKRESFYIWEKFLKRISFWLCCSLCRKARFFPQWIPRHWNILIKSAAAEIWKKVSMNGFW